MIPNPDESRKLKRGLKDLSALFSDLPEPAETLHVLNQGQANAGVQFLALFSEEPAKASTLTRYLGAQLGTESCPCFFIHIAESDRAKGQSLPTFLHRPSAHFQEYRLTWEQCRAAFKQGSFAPKAPSSFENILVFLDFCHTDFERAEKILPLLDKWIFIVEPTLKSMSESCRMIKASQLHTRRVEYFVLIQNAAPGGREGDFFERFSEFISRRIRIQLNWLGCFQSLEKPQPVLHEAAFSQLLSRSLEYSPALKEKKELAELIYTFSQPPKY